MKSEAGGGEEEAGDAPWWQELLTPRKVHVVRNEKEGEADRGDLIAWQQQRVGAPAPVKHLLIHV